MRANHTLNVLMLATLVGFVGCSSGKSSDGGSASTAPPSTTNPTNPTNPGTPTNPPPTSNLQTNALVSSFATNEVIEVDALTGAVNNRWSVGAGPMDVANDLLYSYVGNVSDQSVTVLDRLANNTVASLDVAASPITGVNALSGFVDPLLKPLVRPTGVAVTPDGKKVYSANLLNVTAIDATTFTRTKTWMGFNNLSLQNLIANPSQAINNFLAAPVRGLGMAKVAATDTHALVTCMISGTVMRLDVANDTLIGYTDVGQGPVGITIANNKAYVACALSQEVVVMDVATGVVLKTLAAGMIPIDVAKSKNEDRVYVANAISGDISVIDTAADLVVDTLPAGLSIASIFQQLGVTLPSGTSGSSGVNALLNGFLQGFSAGINNPTSFGSVLFNNNGSLLSPANLVNGLITGFLAYAGVNQQQVAGLNLPGIGIMSVGVAHDPSLVITGNAFLGEVPVTHAATKAVRPITGLNGMGPVDVAPIWPR